MGEYLISPLHLLFGLGLMIGHLLLQGGSAGSGGLTFSQGRLSVVLLGALTFFLAVFLAGLGEGVGNWVPLLAGCGSAAFALVEGG